MGQTFGYTLPAFPGGLNLIDSIDNIPETDCIELLNLWPIGSRLVLRKGIDEAWVAEAGQTIKTLANLILASGTQKLVAAANNTLFIQDGAASDDITGSTTPTNDEWQHVTFNNRLYLVNGEDTPQIYDGTGTATDASFTGTTIANFINVGVYKERLYFVPKNSTSCWYTATVKAVSGALTEFPLGYQFKRGGFLVSCGALTSGVQDLFYALSSEGELLLYQGSYPGDTTWQIINRFFVGKPLGRRASVYVENDLWYITTRGIVPASTLMQAGSSVAANSISRKVNPIIKQAAKFLPFSYIYSAKYLELENMVFINYPVTTSSTRQLVINIETGAWTVYQYSVIGTALCIEISEDAPYIAGSNGIIYLAESGYSDDDLSIQFLVRGGFNYFGKRGLFKVFRDIRPIIKSDAENLTLSLDMDTDYQQLNSYATITVPNTDTLLQSYWNEAAWDTAPWSTEDRYLFDRYSLARQGHCGALRMRGSVSNALLEFNAFEIRFEEGAQV